VWAAPEIGTKTTYYTCIGGGAVAKFSSVARASYIRPRICAKIKRERNKKRLRKKGEEGAETPRLSYLVSLVRFLYFLI